MHTTVINLQVFDLAKEYTDVRVHHDGGWRGQDAIVFMKRHDGETREVEIPPGVLIAISQTAALDFIQSTITGAIEQIWVEEFAAGAVQSATRRDLEDEVESLAAIREGFEAAIAKALGLESCPQDPERALVNIIQSRTAKIDAAVDVLCGLAVDPDAGTFQREQASAALAQLAATYACSICRKIVRADKNPHGSVCEECLESTEGEVDV